MKWPSLLTGLTIAMSNDDALVIPAGTELAAPWRVIRDVPARDRAEAERVTVQFLNEQTKR